MGAGLCGVLLALTACGNRVDDPAEPDRSPAHVAPAGTRPVQMFLSVGTPTDSDGNRLPDTIPALVYLFPDEAISKLPVWAAGEFRFLLRYPDGTEIGRWTYPADIAKNAERTMGPGPAYSFILRLGPGEDRIRSAVVELWGEFVGADGHKARVSSPVIIRMGG